MPEKQSKKVKVTGSQQLKLTRFCCLPPGLNLSRKDRDKLKAGEVLELLEEKVKKYSHLFTEVKNGDSKDGV